MAIKKILFIFVCALLFNCDRGVPVRINSESQTWEIRKESLNLNISAYYVYNVGARVIIQNKGSASIVMYVGRLVVASQKSITTPKFYLGNDETTDRIISVNQEEKLEINFDGPGSDFFLFGKDVFLLDTVFYDVDSINIKVEK